MVMASSTTSTSSSAVPAFVYSIRTLSPTRQHVGTRTPARKTRICAKLGEKSALQYKKLGDSDLSISEITFGTMTFGEQNTEKEAHGMLSYAVERGINALDTAEAYPIPMRKETQGKTDLYIGSWLKSQPREKMTFGEQNTEKEAHEMLSYAVERGINALDTAEAYPIPMRKETQ
ncbi:uncharacterized protein LOC132179784 [Corylus avellana]|uniref:uncharacterized protein LOC132179784 n=1 Tax=Corylus avellana TaxID=13451 RepID=UPI00286D38E6|nr:uncharacterized protein LOC132179784 [Corylus avellana]